MSTEKSRLGISSRLKLLKLFWGLTQKGMSERMGIGLSTYKYYEKSERDIPAIVLLSLTQYGVNPVWLFTGDGDMVSTATNATIDFVDASHAELITRFKQKELAKEINRLMVEIERIDPEELSDLKDYLEFKLLKKTGERPEGWNGKERRNTGR